MIEETWSEQTKKIVEQMLLAFCSVTGDGHMSINKALQHISSEHLLVAILSSSVKSRKWCSLKT